VSYLLIGFWYTRPTAIYANLKAFLVNRVGDFGFLLGIALVLMYFGTLDYATVFRNAPTLAPTPSRSSRHAVVADDGDLHPAVHRRDGQIGAVPAARVAADSMEGPTPISALIHAATMVTAGIFMVARMSPLFELSRRRCRSCWSSARSPRSSWR
jgi:NADH-quinone oxidoreductase subunit L